MSESATESAGSISGSATEATTLTGGESETNASATESDSSGDTGGQGFCGDERPKGYVGPFDASSETEPKTGTFEPVVEWSKKTWTVAPTSNQVIKAPIVATITDDDRDGVYGSAGVALCRRRVPSPTTTISGGSLSLSPRDRPIRRASAPPPRAPSDQIARSP